MTQTPERGQQLGQTPERGQEFGQTPEFREEPGEEPERYQPEEQGADARGLQDPEAEDE